MLAPFIQKLSEYGFVLQSFWNNANQHVVPGVAPVDDTARLLKNSNYNYTNTDFDN
ncbi:MAG TPA: hypothetical protein VNO18_01940 [Xanthobacteraceae bacterium]|jgi:hypothetical protein|nr:hypothetical protein [Xanthobacteraceae bacterium]